jgi:hypothetical protein
MSIKFHCEYCGKKIEAADSAGGKWGKCPACHNKLYVPSLDSGEELKLAPIDETDLEREKRLLAETHRLTQDILQEREVPLGPSETNGPDEAKEPMEMNGTTERAGTTSEMSDIELKQHIITYLRQMANGELYEAQKIEALIASHGARAVHILDALDINDILEPELAGIPKQVISSLIRKLRNEIS